MADGAAVPPRGPLDVLEGELVDADALLAEVAKRLATAEEDQARLRREFWREEAASKRSEAMKLQDELTQVTTEGDALRRRAGELASR